MYQAVTSFCLLLAAVFSASAASAADKWATYDGFDGPGKGKHIVLISGDEEYRSEEALPQLGKILAKHHGFKCSVLFALDEDGTINPNNRGNIPGLELLKSRRLDDHRHPVPRPAGRSDGAHRRVPAGGQAGDRHADRHPRVQHQRRQDLRPLWQRLSRG